MSEHPQQRIINGSPPRFRANAIVEYLLTRSSMNELAAMKFPDEDRRQFAQLIGYSVGGYNELSYVEGHEIETEEPDDNVTSLNTARAVAHHDARLWSPVECLEEAVREIKAGGTIIPSKALVVLLDDTEEKYDTRFLQAGMKISEIVALIALLQHSIMHDIS